MFGLVKFMIKDDLKFNQRILSFTRGTPHAAPSETEPKQKTSVFVRMILIFI